LNTSFTLIAFMGMISIRTSSFVALKTLIICVHCESHRTPFWIWNLAWRDHIDNLHPVPSLIVSLSPLTENAIILSTDEDDHRIG
jgi:hypothetical protein